MGLNRSFPRAQCKQWGFSETWQRTLSLLLGDVVCRSRVTTRAASSIAPAWRRGGTFPVLLQPLVKSPKDLRSQSVETLPEPLPHVHLSVF